LDAEVKGFPLPWLINLETLPQVFEKLRVMEYGSTGDLDWAGGYSENYGSPDCFFSIPR
jgi:hypothetical protein